MKIRKERKRMLEEVLLVKVRPINIKPACAFTLISLTF